MLCYQKCQNNGNGSNADSDTDHEGRVTPTELLQRARANNISQAWQNTRYKNRQKVK
jgi:hypothetical protein